MPKKSSECRACWHDFNQPGRDTHYSHLPGVGDSLWRLIPSSKLFAVTGFFYFSIAHDSIITAEHRFPTP